MVYFQLQGTWLAIFPRGALAGYANVAPEGRGFGGITLSCNVSTRKEVDETLATAANAGASIVRPAAES